MLNLDELSIQQIHQAYKNGDYTCVDLVRAYNKRISEFDPEINAITIVNPEALDIAKKLDQEFDQTGKLRPLHGIPILVKDNINTAGLPTTAGALALENYIPEQDAFIIEKLVDAGAIVLAKTNMAEWAFSPMHTESSTAGTTRNPYNVAHVPAGSSGGTGAGIAANFGTIGLGTDTGNSIRGPSSHNALVGFRTTLGLVSRSAIVPLYLRNDVVGPMCRTVEDATRMLQVIAGYDRDDPITGYANDHAETDYVQYLDKDGLKGARIGVLRELSEEDPDPEISALFDSAIADLRAGGAEIIDPITIPNFADLRQSQWCAEFRKDIESFLSSYVRDTSLTNLEDIIEIGTKSEFAAQRLNRFLTVEGRGSDHDIPCEDAFTDELRIAFRTAIENAMDSLRVDAIIYPSWNNKPAHIDKFQEEYKGDNSQIIAPHTGQPAFTVPMGFTSGNLPAGVQFLGRMFDEPTLIRLAYAYEQSTKHRRPPEAFK